MALPNGQGSGPVTKPQVCSRVEVSRRGQMVPDKSERGDSKCKEVAEEIRGSVQEERGMVNQKGDSGKGRGEVCSSKSQIRSVLGAYPSEVS